MLLKDLVAQFNIVAKTEYVKTMQEYEPAFKNALLFEYQSGMVGSVNFPFINAHIHGMEEFKDSRKHKLIPGGDKFIIVNREWDMAVDVPQADAERSAEANNLKGLDLYRIMISQIPVQVKNHPMQLSYSMLENGTSSVMGTCFDGQPLFSATHSYSINTAGIQNNIVTGTGTSLANIKDDLISVLSAFDSFQNETATDPFNKKLNKGQSKLLIIAPAQLSGVLYELKNSYLIGGGNTNAVKDSFDYMTFNFSDNNDYYVVRIDDERMFKPFLYQIEKSPVLDVPNPNDERLREYKMLTYGAYGRYNVAYGSWWKVVKVTN